MVGVFAFYMQSPMLAKQQSQLSSLPKNTSPEKRLEAVAFALNLTRQELADKLGISLSSIAMYFNGYHRIRKVVALAFENCYGVRANWILHGEKPIYLETKKQGSSLSDKAYELAVTYDSLQKREQEYISIIVPCLKA